LGKKIEAEFKVRQSQKLAELGRRVRRRKGSGISEGRDMGRGNGSRSQAYAFAAGAAEGASEKPPLGCPESKATAKGEEAEGKGVMK